MIIRVMFNDHHYDYLKDVILDEFIRTNSISKIYRNSEGWIVVGKDPVRGDGGTYTGPERRMSGRA